MTSRAKVWNLILAAYKATLGDPSDAEGSSESIPAFRKRWQVSLCEAFGANYSRFFFSLVIRTAHQPSPLPIHNKRE
jgi:hypothetical protein